MLLLAVAMAERPHTNLAVELGVEVPLGKVEQRVRGITGRLGVAKPWIFGDPCAYAEPPDCRQASGWALGGIRGAVRGSLADGPSLDLGGYTGVMHSDMMHVGWVPLWQLELRAGVEVGLDGASLAVGGVGSRSLGRSPLAAQLGFVARPLGVKRPPTLLTGLGMHTKAGVFY